MLTRITSLTHLSKRSVPVTHYRSPREAKRVISLSNRSCRLGGSRLLHLSSANYRADPFKADPDDIISIVIPTDESSVTQKYWPKTDPSTSSGYYQPPQNEALNDEASNSEEESRPEDYSALRGRNQIRSEFSTSSRSMDFDRNKRQFNDEYTDGQSREGQHSMKGSYGERENPGTRKWETVRSVKGSKPTSTPRYHQKTMSEEDSIRANAQKRSTLHLTDKSIHMRQSITQASSPEIYERECAIYEQAPNFDRFTWEVSRLIYLEKNNAPLNVQDAHAAKVISVVQKDLVALLKTQGTDDHSELVYSGEKVDLAISLVRSSSFVSTGRLLETIVEYLEVKGKFDPPVLPSSWRRIWTSIAYLVTQDGFGKLNHQHLCELSVALFYYVYLHQLEMSGHSRRAEPIKNSQIVYLPRDAPASMVTGATRSPKSLLNLEVSPITITTGDCPLIRGPQAISAMLAILSQVSGHVSLKRAIVDLFGTMVLVPNAFPLRRMVPLAGLLFSWGELPAARACMQALQSASPSEIDHKASQYEILALDHLMVGHNAAGVLEFAESMASVPGHIPSPLSLTPIVWAVKDSQEYGRVMVWWRKATSIWRSIPTSSQQGSRPFKILVRIPMETSMSLLDIAMDHLTVHELEEITNDFIDVFGIRPAGSRSRVIIKCARDGDIKKAIELLSSGPSKKKLANDQPGSTGASPFIMAAKIVLSMVENNQFDDHIEDLLETLVATSNGPFCPGELINFVSSMHEDVASYEQAQKWVPFLKWIASLPMPDGSLLNLDFECPSAAFTTRILTKSLEHQSGTQLTMRDLVRTSARTLNRLAETAGLTGLPAVVKSIITRVNMQYTHENQGKTMPFSSVWLRPLVQSHAYAGHADTVYQLLASLKQSMLPSERESIWKASFKAYCKMRDTTNAINFFINVRNQSIDDAIPTWSGGYTMSIQLLIGEGRFAEAFQMYSLMIEDGFELRDRSIVLSLTQHLQELVSKHTLEHQDSTIPTTGNDSYDTLLNRLVLLEPTLDDSKPNRSAGPGKNMKRRHAKERKLSEKFFISNLDRAMGTYKSTSRRNTKESL